MPLSRSRSGHKASQYEHLKNQFRLKEVDEDWPALENACLDM